MIKLSAFSEFIAQSPEMTACLEQAKRAAENDVSVVIEGENGTGKTMLAEAMHLVSKRKSGPCISLNCGSISESLIESELFGHVKGAFTGAERDHKGRFELADRGTLILDEVTSLSPAGQVKILRAAEGRGFEKVGGEETLLADVRLVAITNQDMRRRVHEGKFRRDLWYRLNVINIRVPPLRGRKTDIPLLIGKAIEECNIRFGTSVRGPSEVAMSFMTEYEWPGNVRELFSTVKRAVIAACKGNLWIEHLGIGPYIKTENDSEEYSGPSDFSLESAEKRHIEKVLKMTGGNKRQASRLLGISRTTLDSRLGNFAKSIRNSEQSDGGLVLTKSNTGNGQI